MAEPPEHERKPREPQEQRVHPAPPPGDPEKLPKPLRPSSGRPEAFVVPSHPVNTVGFDETKLCLPSRFGTLLATVISSVFMLIGLLLFSIAERGFSNFQPSDAWLILLFRVLGLAFLFYIPILWIAAGFVRGYVFQGQAPGQSLRQMFRHGLWCAIFIALICIPFDGSRYFGLLPVYLLGMVCVPLGLPLSFLFYSNGSGHGPMFLSSTYAPRVAPACVFLPTIGFSFIATVYTPLHHFTGVWLGLLMPALLSAYEFLGTALVLRIFTRQFLTQREVRKNYRGTNQGIIVSTAICNLHAMAEGARLALLSMDGEMMEDWSILAPVLSGVIWNVLVRIGCLDRFLYAVTCGRWKPNNGSRLLRKSALCIGYMRFGSILALLIARLCLGTLSWESPELPLFGMMLAAEIFEDLLTSLLWMAEVNVTPELEFTKDEDVEIAVRKEITRRSSKGSLLAVAPQATKPRNKESLRWEVRVARDFRYGPLTFGTLPFWAHLVPATLAQFHTILTMSVFSNGLVYMLGICHSGQSRGVFRWPVDAPCDA